MSVAVYVTIVLFLLSQIIIMVKWSANLDKVTGILASRIDSLTEGLRQVEEVIRSIADVNTRFNYVESTSTERNKVTKDLLADHEKRIRFMELGCAKCLQKP